MRIGLVGISNRTLELAQALGDAGHEVSIFTVEPFYNALPASCLSAWQGDVLALLNGDFDLFRIMDALSGIHLFFVWGLHEGYNRDKLAMAPPASALAAAIQSSHWRLFTNTTFQATWLLKNFGRSCSIVFDGINREIFSLPSHRPPRFIAGFMENKEVERALSLAQPYVPSLVAKKISGFPPAAWYASITIFVNGQLYTGLDGNPVAHAMACGVPVVCYNVGDNQDLAYHKKTAWAVPKGSVVQLADGIINLLLDEFLHHHLAENATRTIQSLTWAATATQFLEAIKKP